MLSGLSWPWLAVLMALGMALDLLLGEARRWHPLVGFGHLAQRIEALLNARPGLRLRGVLAWSLAVLPAVLLTIWLLSWLPWWLSALLHAALLYFCIGLRSLREHTLPIAQALATGELEQARRLTSYIVSRDTRQSNEQELAKAGVESLLENGNDAVFGTLFWFLVAGGPGALLFRLANTLDAMWGYRTERFLQFGWAAARIDDVLNWIPARLTALSYAWLGQRQLAMRCWQQQAPAWSSPNAGPVMAAGAGALGLALGGPAIYDGELEQRPPLGLGQPPQGPDIVRAWRLVAMSAALWLAVVGAVAVLCLGGSHA
ncbi:cobalamin biosynthesis protein CobD [Herbaspirillum rubrisubalbicans]|uniref:Cobalamin biosynthesis protein CobD n=1 Tax=Herbaspirillum rubrisubalbicans TaxID=80842 RepID=A0ABX9BZ15_9BURK|nr:adenosylcobinamide-phosphate synthase CbiB [Herbaspirillum rubrisubalbicans]RAM63252.1 cobalamin biosynthesis protein CobD [Herbaspirillum rubrisubalbicans]RAN48530.1 cobalamin biosynthesis protein CobD [Herbaspirillum rubrisubalbicans]